MRSALTGAIILLSVVFSVGKGTVNDKVEKHLKKKEVEEAVGLINKRVKELEFEDKDRMFYQEIIWLHNKLGEIEFNQFKLEQSFQTLLIGKSHLLNKVNEYPSSVKEEDLFVYDNLALASLDLGDFVNTELFLAEADSLKRKLKLKTFVHGSKTDLVYAEFYLETRKEKLAKQHFQKVIKATLSGFYRDADIIGLASAYNGLAIIELKENRPWEAERLAKTSRKYGKSNLAQQVIYLGNENEVVSLNILARSSLRMGQIEEAKDYSNQAMQLYLRDYEDSTMRFIDVWMTRAEVLWQGNEFDEAHDCFNVANQIQLDYTLKTLPNISETAKENFYYEFLYNTNIYYSFCSDYVLEQKGDALGKVRVLKELLELRLNTKGKILSETNRVMEYVQNSADPEVVQLRKIWKKKRDDLSRMVGRGFSERALSEVKTEIDDLEKEFTVVLKKNGIRFETKKVRVGDIPVRLENGEVAIEAVRLPAYKKPARISKEELKNYKKYDSLTLTSIIDFSDPRYLFLKIDSESSLEYKVVENGEEMENKGYKGFRAKVQYKIEDRASYNLYFEPLEMWLGDSKTMFFSADGIYNQVNLGVLQNPRTNRFVVEDYTIYNVSSLDEVADKSMSSKIEFNSATLIGRPAYSLNSIQIAPDSNTAYIGERGIEEFHSGGIADLPGTEVEINSIQSTLSGLNVATEKYLKTEATETLMKQHKSNSILHISTHGFFVKKQDGQASNPMMRSGLLLAGVSDYDSTMAEDGILTAYEASGLDLKNTELVVLSACETGLGEIKNGEGVYGLQRAFQIAGVRYVLMSMWKVDDNATMLLMTTFYKRLAETKDVRQSFTEAQLAVKKDYPEVYYWGAFKLIGN